MNNVPPGYKQTEVGVIPEEWKVKPFTQVTELITCGIAATPKYVPESRGYPFLSSTNVKEGQIVWSGYKYISADLHRQLYRNNPPKRGDILYSRVGTFGEAAVVEVDFEFSVYVSLTLIKPGKSLDSFFLMQLLNSDAYKRRAKDQIYLGGGVGNLNVDVVRRYPIVVPPLPEQRAIATALSDVDALLGALDRLIAKKRDLKQAAMQQLLTGQTRLPGFHGEWEIRPLRIFVRAFIVPMRDKPKNFAGDIPWCRIEDFDGIYLTSSKSGQSVDAETVREMNLKVYPAGTLLVSCSADLGRCAIVARPLVSNQTFIGLEMNETVSSNLFFYYLMTSKAQELNDLSSGTTISYLSREQFEAFTVLAPSDMDEQTAIAAVLTDMDAELALLEQRLAKTRALKQGMMQELLTGRTRLV